MPTFQSFYPWNLKQNGYPSIHFGWLKKERFRNQWSFSCISSKLRHTSRINSTISILTLNFLYELNNAQLLVKPFLDCINLFFLDILPKSGYNDTTRSPRVRIELEKENKFYHRKRQVFCLTFLRWRSMLKSVSFLFRT